LKKILALLLLATVTMGAPAQAGTTLSLNDVVTSSVSYADYTPAPPAKWIPRSHIMVSAISGRGRASQIYTFDVDSGARKIVAPGTLPVPSPDGRRVAFLRSEVATDGSTSWDGTTNEDQLWVADLDGSNALQLSHVRGGVARLIGFPFAWSPDSKRLEFQSTTRTEDFNGVKPVSDGKPRAAVVVYPDALKHRPVPYLVSAWVVDAGGGHVRAMLSHHGLVGDIGWLNNATLLYEHDNNGYWETLHTTLTAIDVATGRMHIVLTGYQKQTGYVASIAPGGGRVAARVNPGEEQPYPARQELAIETVRDHHVRLYARNGDVGSSFAWRHDGGVLFTNGNSTQRRIEAAMPDGTTKIVYDVHGFRDGIALSDDDKYLSWTLTKDSGTVVLQLARLTNERVSSVQTLTTLNDPTLGVTIGSTVGYDWTSRDGVHVDGLLTLPVGYVRGKKYPMIVMIHGGPTGAVGTGRAEWPGGMDFIEYFAQRGIATFQPDYRASGYLGWDKIVAERKRHSAFQGDFDDIMSGVEALERAGIADPAHEAVIGHSYGGLEVNWIIGQTHHFAAAVAYEAGQDWYYDWGTSFGPDPYSQWKLDATPFTMPDVFRKNSTLTYAGAIRTPTMFVNAEFGINAKYVQWLYAAELANGVPTKYIEYFGESHNIIKPVNQLDFMTRVAGWIERYAVHNGAHARP
jgi:dipeptidyl aminopeptidase/acylaminoacyl peptidase